MSGDVQTTSARASIPAIGRWLPTATVHVVFFAVAAALCLLVLERPFWLAVGLSLSVLVTLAPHRVPAWWLLLVLGLSQVWREPSVTDVAFYLLLAGVHLLHVLGSFARLLPWNGRVQAVALVPPLKRFVLVQAFAQVTAVGALFAFGDGRGGVPGMSIVAAAVLSLMAVLLARRLPKAEAGA